jgi:predicted RND superfamily exporter protein
MMPNRLNPLRESLSTADLINLIALENDAVERHRLTVQLGFTDIIDRLIGRLDGYESDTSNKLTAQAERLEQLENDVESHKETILVWRTTIKLTVALVVVCEGVLGALGYKAYETTTKMYKEVQELSIMIPKIRNIQAENHEQTKVLSETKAAVENTQSEVSKQQDRSSDKLDKIDDLDREINRIKKLKAVRGSR